MNRFLKCAILLAGSLLFGTTAIAQEAPKPITVLSPFGQGPDALNPAAEVFTEMLGERLGTKAELVFDKSLGNVTGYTCTKAPADGTVVLFGGFGPAVLDTWYEKLPYTPSEQLRYVGQVSWMPIMLFAAPDAPFDDLHSFVAYAKKNPGMTVGIGKPRGGSPEPSTALLAKLAGIEVTFTDQTVNDLADGKIMAAAFHPFGAQYRAVRAGKAKPIATYTPARLPYYPDTPTLVEQGYPMAFTSWRMVAVPRATDDATFNKIVAAVESIAKDPRFHAALTIPSGELPMWRGPEETQKWIDAQTSAYGKIIEYVGLTGSREKK